MSYSYPYNMFNQSFFEQQQAVERFRAMQYDQEQRKAIDDATKAINDFVDALNKIDPPYQRLAEDAIIATLLVNAASLVVQDIFR